MIKTWTVVLHYTDQDTMMSRFVVSARDVWGAIRVAYEAVEDPSKVKSITIQESSP